MIRNFIYLDSDKLRSLSSQLFEGVTEQVVSTHASVKGQEDKQKGPVASGRILADIFAQERSSSELKFLEDHAYTLFEQRLIEQSLMDSVDSDNVQISPDKSFVRVTSKLQMNDLSKSAEMLKGFNQLGESFWRVSNEQFLWKAGEKITGDTEVKRKASEIGLQANQKVTEAASYLLQFGYQDLLEANMALGDKAFSAPLKREFLREEESMIIHKYSRSTQGEFTMLGVITQRGDASSSTTPLKDVKEGENVKEALRLFTGHLNTFESFFSAPLKNEIVLDPLAIYSVL